MKAQIKAFVFDVYGTLFDVHSVKEKCDELYPGKGEEISTVWRQKQLEYSFLRQLMGRYEPFLEVTRSALHYALAKLELPLSNSNEEDLIAAYKKLTPYPEVEAVLKQLQPKERAVFSNGSPDMLNPLIESSSLSSYIDKIITVDDIKHYKPTPASYQHALTHLGLKREEILFMSSNGWDITGAKSFGFQTAWINRQNLPKEELGITPNRIYKDLTGILEWD
ncbi:haloacid dehalogenase type II [Bacillus sp. 2205SS5-2]|uniref:haloacid dehalogenase type II n=1 Tax=Bacillus sp. 2205SS5-2 TaxID=3109031 RepID=UPI003006F94D